MRNFMMDFQARDPRSIHHSELRRKRRPIHLSERC
jgi:hypothetical protein